MIVTEGADGWKKWYLNLAPQLVPFWTSWRHTQHESLRKALAARAGISGVGNSKRDGDKIIVVI